MERVILLPSTGKSAASRQLSRILKRRRPATVVARRDERSTRDVLTVILCGGQGTRLHPLTIDRAKPAVPVGGKYRLVDVSISNSLNSGLERIFVLTQFNSASLHRHLATTYRLDAFSRGFVEVLAAEQTQKTSEWYQGTADAVRKQLERIRELAPRDVVILSGDHLYSLDIRDFLARHRHARADVTVAVTPVRAREAPQFGLVRESEDGRIVEFVEKPNAPELIERFAATGLPGGFTHLASMGIYVFRREALEEMLREGAVDFGRNVLPEAVGTRSVAAFRFDGYWEDLGTIGAYHRANLELAERLPRFDFFVPENPVYTLPRALPASRISGARLDATLLSEGCILGEDASITRSVLGPRSFIGRGTRIDQSVLFGATTFADAVRADGPKLGIGERCSIRRAIVDEDVRIGDGVVLENSEGIREHSNPFLVVREGVIVVPRGTVIPDGYVF
jgi:glucose-1-phosphate adenylyltransferase